MPVRQFALLLVQICLAAASLNMASSGTPAPNPGTNLLSRTDTELKKIDDADEPRRRKLKEDLFQFSPSHHVRAEPQKERDSYSQLRLKPPIPETQKDSLATLKLELQQQLESGASALDPQSLRHRLVQICFLQNDQKGTIDFIKQMEKQYPACTVCKTNESVRPVSYGYWGAFRYPSGYDELHEMFDYHLGGCNLKSARWYCNHCSSSF